MKRILAWFLALIMVFGMVSLPKMTKAEGEEVPDQPESVDEIVNDAKGESKAPGTKDGQYWERNAFYFFPTNLTDHGFFDDLKPDKEASKKSLESSVAY